MVCLPNSTILVIQHTISVQTVQCGRFQMDEYSSLKFSKLYLNTYIPVSCKLYMLQLTKILMLMFTAMKQCVDLINNNGKLTVVGWYRRGFINNKSPINTRNICCAGIKSGNKNFNSTKEDVQVESGEISYHICKYQSQ